MIEHFRGEKFKQNIEKEEELNLVIDLEKKYKNGDLRIVTEQNKISLYTIKQTFQDNMEMKPEYQRRKRWGIEKKSKLIESIIMNIPIPPVFLYEIEFNKYEVMDGLQRISTIIDFYDNKFRLVELNQWAELNGKTFEELPSIIKNAINRRNLLSIVLLQESAKTEEEANRIKKFVFERLNSGGVELSPQEIRNALYDGKLNRLCLDLSENKIFKKLWNIKDKQQLNLEFEEDSFQSYENKSDNKMYTNMNDVEQVLKFFAFRHIDKFNDNLKEFLDDFLNNGNNFPESVMVEFKLLFEKTINIAYDLFGEKAFKNYTGKKWGSIPVRTIADPLLHSIMINNNILENIEKKLIKEREEKLKEFYLDNSEGNTNLFNGKKQSRTDIKRRIEGFNKLIKKIVEENYV